MKDGYLSNLFSSFNNINLAKVKYNYMKSSNKCKLFVLIFSEFYEILFRLENNPLLNKNLEKFRLLRNNNIQFKYNSFMLFIDNQIH